MRNRQGMKSMWVVLALVALAISSTIAVMGADSVTPPLQQDATATPAAEPFADDAAYAEDLWQRLQEANYNENWSTIPGKGELYPGQPPHGALLSTYLNAPAFDALEEQPGEMPNSAIVIKENYHPDETLASVTVMEKRAGYAPDYGDWYWARYGPDGAVQGNGQIASCIGCHGAVRSNDYIFTFVVAPIDVSALAAPPPAETVTATMTATVTVTGTDAAAPAQQATPTPDEEPVEAETVTETSTPSPAATTAGAADDEAADDEIEGSVKPSEAEGPDATTPTAEETEQTDQAAAEGTVTPSPEATSPEEAGDAETDDTATDDEATGDEAEGSVKPSETEGPAAATPTATPETLSSETLISKGEEVYTNYCAACHQPDGEGVAGAYPPLAGNPFVTAEDPTPVLRVVFTGRAGMPHFRDYLTEQEIASAVSYVRNAWENNASVVPVEQVNEVQTEIYSPSEPMQHSGEGD